MKVSIPKSDNLITSSSFLRRDKSTSNELTKSFGKQETSISLTFSLNIAPSLTASEVPIKFK